MSILVERNFWQVLPQIFCLTSPVQSLRGQTMPGPSIPNIPMSHMAAQVLPGWAAAIRFSILVVKTTGRDFISTALVIITRHYSDLLPRTHSNLLAETLTSMHMCETLRYFSEIR